MKNIIIKSVLALIAGVIIGILAKWGDVIPGMNFIYYFGLITSGVLIWLIIGTLLILKSKNRIEFNVLYSAFMIPMLISYYLFSALIVKYIYTKIIIFWLIIFICSVVLGNIIFNKKYTNIFRIIYILAAIVFIVFDAIKINGIQLQVVIPEILLSIIVLVLINKNISKAQQ